MSRLAGRASVAVDLVLVTTTLVACGRLDPGRLTRPGTTVTATVAALAVTPPDTVAPAPTPEPLLALLRSPMPKRDLADLAVRMGRAPAPLPGTAVPAPARQVGDRERFWVHDIEGQRYFRVEAVLRVVTDEAYFWVQDGQAADTSDLEAGAREFSQVVVPAVHQVFGQESRPGVDGDPRMHLLHHQPTAGVAGYFSSTDEFTPAVEPYSNQREMFYVNLGTYKPGSFEYLSLLTHELQHMVHWNQDRGEAVWVNEGLSELATAVAGYQSQFGDAFLQEPDTALAEWQPESGANATHYAAAFLFFAYLRAQYGDAAIQAIVAAPDTGMAGVESGLAAAGVPQSFDDVFQDWVVANLVDDARRVGGRYSYGRSGINRVEPAPVPAADWSGTVNQYGTDYFDVTPLVTDGQLHLDFAGDTAVGLLEPVPSQPGQVWWSGRADNGDSRLTRRFDLRGATAPVLRFRRWLQLEENWDYAYVLVSADDGRTWTRLPWDGATDDNPNGNNYGRGLTGDGEWLDTAVDLAPYAGQDILLRFEVVTDDAVSLSGLALDGLRLDAVGFTDDGEADAGWQAEGWVRIDPRLPQRWSIQTIVEHAKGIDIQRVPVAANGRARIALDDIPADAEVTLAISGLTPATRHPAGYGVTATATAAPADSSPTP